MNDKYLEKFFDSTLNFNIDDDKKITAEKHTRTFCCEYIWIDGTTPTAMMRSKTMSSDYKRTDVIRLSDFHMDHVGSSTNQRRRVLIEF